jgi:phosphate:Na+ symporter
MTATYILLTIISGVCLMLWGVRMVKLGFIRAYGASLRQVIAKGTKNRFTALVSGFGVTLLLQSSTATALMLTSFADRGMIAVSAAIAVMIGADIGTTILAQIFTFDLKYLSPLLLITGVILHMIYENGGKMRHAARIIIGLSFILMSLGLIREAAIPLKESDVLPLIIEPLNNEHALALCVAVLLTWLMHSSLAAVLLFSAMSASGVIPLYLTLVMILGANIGAAITPIIATMKDSPLARRIPIGNLMMRLITSIIMFFFLGYFVEFFEQGSIPADRIAVTFHMIYNIVLACIFLPWTQHIASMAEKIMPDNKENDNPMLPQYLDKGAVNSPPVALTCAARETLRLADYLEKMLNNTIEIFEKGDTKLIETTRKYDNIIDSVYKSIKLYMTKLTQEEFDRKEADKYVQILTFSTNLEHAGDIIDKSLLEMAEKKIRNQDSFSKEGFEEIKKIHKMVVENLRLAQNLFLAQDRELAQQLLNEKKLLRVFEKKSTVSHFQRMTSGLSETLATSSLHLDIVRDYRRINTYVTSVAYSILDKGEETPHWFGRFNKREITPVKYEDFYDFDAGVPSDLGPDDAPQTESPDNQSFIDVTKAKDD